MHKYLENYLIALKANGDGDKALLYSQKKTPVDLAGTMEQDRIDMGRDLFYNIYNEGLLNKIQKIVFTERFLWSTEHLFAGTADHGFLTFNNKIILGDFKSASSPRGEEQIHKNKMQLGAYAIAFEENFGYRVSGAEIWIAHPTGVQIVEMNYEELQEAKNDFLELLNEFHSQWDPIKMAQYIHDNNVKNSESQNV
jgi:CRISPR/Cas system-associated exonuclease Cas4 (RecB family)